tara:strand:+ start:168 stop:1586 length:1419 start_codon:yes stop_codon:yes gene_type:complete
MAKPITNKVKTGQIPVIKKDLDSGVIAEANNDGTIYLDKSVKNDSPLAKEAIAHEMVHMDQMARGDLNYNDDKVFWKGKEYDRDDMNEGSKQLPWEKEAYDKTKNMKKSPNKYSLSKGAIRTNRDVVTTKLRADADKTAAIGAAVGTVTSKIPSFDDYENQKDNDVDVGTDDLVTDSGANMNLKNKNKSAIKMKSTPITQKAKSPAKLAPLAAMAGKALIGAAANKVVDSAMKMKSPLHVETTETREFKGNLGDETGTFTETKTTKKSKEKKESVKNFANSCYNEDGSKKAEGTIVGDIKCSWKDDEDFDPESEYETKEETIYDTAFQNEKDKVVTPGDPGRPNMGYYESLDSKMGAGVRGRSNKRVNRKANSAGAKFDRMDGRGKTPLNPKTGEPYTREEYIKNVSGAFEIPDAFVGKREKSTPGSEKEVIKGADPDKQTYKIVDGEAVAVMNKNNKNKSAFKMKGWKAYN